MLETAKNSQLQDAMFWFMLFVSSLLLEINLVHKAATTEDVSDQNVLLHKMESFNAI